MELFFLNPPCTVGFVNGYLNSYYYYGMLKGHLLPYTISTFSGSWVFQEDTCPSHSAENTVSWFIKLDILVLRFPSRSPDINHIENLWAISKQGLK